MADPEAWITVAKASEVPPMSMKRVVVGETEVTIVNLDGEFFAVGDRCGHMNAPLSRGRVVKNAQGTNVVVCPLHGSTFDPTTGKNLTGPVKAPPSPTAGPPPLSVQLSAMIGVHDIESYKVKREGEDIKLMVVPSPR
jgi:nitrite reductase/ring-hydroxylating ferredoxin subunit